MVGIVASRRQRAHCCTCVSAQVLGQMCRSIVGRKMVGGMLIGALSISIIVTDATATLAQSSAVSGSKPRDPHLVGSPVSRLWLNYLRSLRPPPWRPHPGFLT